MRGWFDFNNPALPHATADAAAAGATPYWQDPHDPIVQQYQANLGRLPESEAAYQSHLVNGRPDPNLAANLYNSPEAQTYRSQPPAAAATPPASTTGTGDPARDAVMAAFAQKGVTPNPGEVDYWVGKINDTGGWGNPDNRQYWTSRMAQDQGGVGDRQGRPEAGNSAAAATPNLLAPYTKTFNYAPFQAPTGITEQNDPGFQSRLQLGQQALERSAAAKGTLLTGGTAKDEQAFGQDFASNEYSNVYGRAANDYNTNRNNAYQQYLGDQATFYANQNNPFAKLLSLSSLDQQGQIANNALGLGYATLNSSNINAANNLGFNYATAGANTLMNGANAYGNYTTQAGNANAAGAIGGANAWQNAFGATANGALGAYYGTQATPYYGTGHP